MRKYTFLVLLLFCFTAHADLRVRPASWATPVIGANLENMYRVDKGVYRSEQPDDDEFVELFKFGVTDVLNLREYHSDNGEAENSHLVLHRIKMNAGSVSQQQIIEALKIIKARKKAVLVHCWHGSDRTGATIAAYRIIFNSWSKQQALDEMVNGGFGYHASIYPNLVKLINDLDVRKIKKVLRIEK